MRRHALVTLSSLKKDRKAGMSILDLVKKYSLSKTTIWHHVKDIELSIDQKKFLRSRMGAGARRAEERWSAARLHAKTLLKGFNEESVWPILLAALYWSEGTKKSGFVFTNTDESMIRLFLKILREKLEIKSDDLDILIRTCSPMDTIACRQYWSLATGIPVENIRVNHDDKQNKGKTAYGVCRITLRKGGYHLKLMHCLIRDMTAKMLESSRSSTDRTSHS